MPQVASAAPLGGPKSIEIQPNAWLRNQRRTRAWAGLAAAWSLIFAGLLLRSGKLTLIGYLVSAVVYLGIAGLGMALAWRVARAGVWIGADGIVVRGPFRTRTIALADAVGFAPGLQGRGGNGTPCPMLECSGQRPVGVWALGRRNIWFRYQRLCQEIQPLCDQLNLLIAHMR